MTGRFRGAGLCVGLLYKSVRISHLVKYVRIAVRSCQGRYFTTLSHLKKLTTYDTSLCFMECTMSKWIYIYIFVISSEVFKGAVVCNFLTLLKHKMP